MTKQLDIIRFNLDENCKYSTKVECLFSEIDRKLQNIELIQRDIKELMLNAWLFKVSRRKDCKEIEEIREEVRIREARGIRVSFGYFVMAIASIAVVGYCNIWIYFQAPENKMS